MKVFTTLLTLLLSLFLLPCAMATDWTTVIHQKDTEISVDMDSYGEEHGYPHLLIKETPKKTHANASEKTYYEKSSTPLFNCL